jgi:hypothetical protein
VAGSGIRWLPDTSMPTSVSPDSVKSQSRSGGGHQASRVRQRVVETIKAPDLLSGGDVVAIGDSVWATAYDDQTLVELRTR